MELSLPMKAEAAAELTKSSLQLAVNKFKNVLVKTTTTFKDVTSVTMICVVDKTKATVIFSLTPVGAKYTVSNM